VSPKKGCLIIAAVLAVVIGIGIAVAPDSMPRWSIFQSKGSEDALLQAAFNDIRTSNSFPSQVQFHRWASFSRKGAERKALRGFLVVVEDSSGLHVYQSVVAKSKTKISVDSREAGLLYLQTGCDANYFLKEGFNHPSCGNGFTMSYLWDSDLRTLEDL
jgi:hypothetical protein